jgi:hypothetical protein
MGEAGLPQAWTLALLAGAAARCGAELSGRRALNARVNAFALELLRRVTAQANVEAGAGVGGGVKRLQRAHVEAALRGLGLARYVRGSPEQAQAQAQASARPGATAVSGSKGAGKSRAAPRSAASGAAPAAGGKGRAAAGGKGQAAARGSAAASQGGGGAKRRRPAAAEAAAPEPAFSASSKRRKVARAPKLSATEQAALAREQDLVLARSAARAC